MKVPTLTKVSSSNIDAMGHSGAGLFVRFHSGMVYQYPEVPREVYEAGLTAPSVGSWFAGAVRGRYKTVRLDDGQPDAG